MDLPAGTILVSACLLGEPCRYDGASVPNAKIIELLKTKKHTPICPEQLAGLSTPRTPSEIQPDGRVVDQENVDRTEHFEAGAQAALRIASEQGCQCAILKAKSPSCGVRNVYDGTFSGTVVAGQGKTAAILAEAGIKLLDETDFDDSRTA